MPSFEDALAAAKFWREAEWDCVDEKDAKRCRTIRYYWLRAARRARKWR